MDNKELISIIIPVYNVEKYLERCVGSVLNQTYKNLEIILVDDGSPDNSGRLCDELAKIDSRIVVYHKENGGLSDARNYGVARAKGNYIGFVDSDDYVHENMYNHLYEIIKMENADVAECGVTRVYGNTERPHYNGEDYYLVLNEKTYLEEYLKIKKVYGSVWCKLIKRELADKLSFPKGKIYEDIYYNYDMLKNHIKCVVVNNPYYYYYIRKGSITTEKFNNKHMDLIEILDKLKEYVDENYSEYSDYALIRQTYGYMSIINQILKLNNYKNIEEYKVLKNRLKPNMYKIIKSKNAEKSLKLGIMLLYFNSKLYKIVLDKYKSKWIEND